MFMKIATYKNAHVFSNPAENRNKVFSLVTLRRKKEKKERKKKEKKNKDV